MLVDVPWQWIRATTIAIVTSVGCPEQAAFASHGIAPAQLLTALEKSALTWNVPRTNDLALICSGEGGAAVYADKIGLNATTMDWINGEWYNLLAPIGVVYAMWCILSLKPKALMWASPNCKSWLSFISRNWSQRGYGTAIVGNYTIAEVEDANAGAIYIAYFLVVCATRDVFTALEQPINTLLYKFPAICDSLLMVGGTRFVSSLGAFGASSMKMLEVYTTLPVKVVKKHLVKKGSAFRKRCAREHRRPKQLATKKGHWTTGKREAMHASRAYPLDFCIAMVQSAIEAAA